MLPAHVWVWTLTSSRLPGPSSAAARFNACCQLSAKHACCPSIALRLAAIQQCDSSQLMQKVCLMVFVRTAIACSARPTRVTSRSSCCRKKWTPQLTGWKRCVVVHRVTAPQRSSCKQKRSRQGASSGLRGKAAMQQGRMADTHQLPVELAVSVLLVALCLSQKGAIAICWHKGVPWRSAGIRPNCGR